MASAFSHVAIPLVIKLASRVLSWRLILLGMLLSVAPDFDVIAFRFGIPYESQWGHRGFTHSIIFAALIAAACMLFATKLRSTKWTVFWVAFVSMASHSILDALTNGGLGVAAFWPFTSERYFLPWQVIEVSPIGVANFFTERGWAVIKSELVYIWLPSLILGISFRLTRS